MTATITPCRTIGLPVYEAVIRRGPVVLWSETFRSEIKAYAETQREFWRLAA